MSKKSKIYFYLRSKCSANYITKKELKEFLIIQIINKA